MKIFRILQIMSLIGVLIPMGCSDFLEKKSQDEVIVTTVSDFDEFLLGSGYVTYVQYTNLYFLDDDIEYYESEYYDELSDVMASYGFQSWQPDMWESEEVIRTNWETYTSTYSRIMGVNAVLDGIDKARGEIEARDQVKAEALALRGYYYFMLVSTFGEPYNYNKKALGVPLKLSADIDENGMPRNTVEEVYMQIVEDLRESSALFEKYPKRRGNYRINLPTVNILLSRVYLHMERWDSVIVAANKAIQYSEGLTDYTKFSGSNFFMCSYDHSEVEWIYGVGVNIQFFGPSADLLSRYDKNDCRPGMWFDMGEYSTNRLLKKDYDWMSGSATPVNTVRISEAYLNRAEAYVQKGMTGEALADLNEVRCNRITGYTNIENVPANLLEEVRLERRLELCFDEQRWFDLRRYGMPSITHRYRYRKSDPWVIYTLREKDPLYTLPLPNEAIRNNVRLEQNASAYEPKRSGVEE
ncbi:RagB/SusD family nutrient uptake outer membrane protein [Butyricimonas hominis]|uniref:RagB/SusD family nutrient uptake outer membrane protein n=1 Tax=Butyricimonas hominis TaxID=2763032 RepID=UPI00351981F3